MPWSNRHMPWLQPTNHRITTSTGKRIEVLELNPDADPETLSAWAKHFRNHYCADTMIDDLRDGTNLSRKEYLEQIVFPDRRAAPGPSVRAGDFGEILAADYLEYILHFWVPRGKYEDKAVRNESVKGCDTIGFKFEDDPRNDTLAVFESKAQFSGNTALPRLQDAVDDSAKDYLRQAESLNALKRRFLKAGDRESSAKIKRFQNRADNEYRELYGAIAHYENEFFDISLLEETNDTTHPHNTKLILIVIKGSAMMELVHAIYKRAADEA